METPPAQGSYQTYIVKKGDSIASVALSHGMKKAELSKVNSMYGSPQLLRGQALLVRAEQAKPPPPPAAAAATAVLSKSGHGEDILSHSGHLLVDFKREPVRQRKAVHRAASDTGLLTRMSAAIFSSSSSNSNSASSSATDSDTGAVPAAVTGVSSLLSRHRSRRTTLPNLDHEAAAAAAQNSTNASAGAAAARTWRSYFTTPAAAVPENSSTSTVSASSSSSNGDTVQARAKSDCTAAVSSAVAEAIASVSTTATATDTQQEPVIVIARRRSRSDITSSSTHNSSDLGAQTYAANSSDSANTSTATAAAAATAATTANDDASTANNGEQYWSGAVDVDGICSAMHSDDEADVSADVCSDVTDDEPELPRLVQHYYTTTASGKQQHYTVPLLVNGESDIVLPQAIALMEEALPDNRKGYNWVLLFSTFNCNQLSSRFSLLVVALQQCARSVAGAAAFRATPNTLPSALQLAIAHETCIAAVACVLCDMMSCRHGANYIQFYERVKAEEPTYIVVETMEGEVLGGFAASPWHIDKNHTGNNISYLVQLKQYAVCSVSTNICPPISSRMSAAFALVDARSTTAL
eukprot:6186-Heterococcus_DN1.PRE.6